MTCAARLYRLLQTRLLGIWSRRAVRNPSSADALAIVRNLRIEGDLKARLLAEQIEQDCHAAE